MTTYLDRILERHREVATTDDRPVGRLLDEAQAMPAARGFRAALAAAPHLAVISEVKRRSPSKGDLHPDLDPAELAATYARGGASCLSVLTDVEFFGGSVADLQAARAACALPVLRKDFTIGARDVLDARLMGADCVLLIAAALEPAALVDLHRLAVDIGLDVLVEIHGEAELDVALSAGATLIGVNQRDLVTFRVDTDRAVRVAATLPDHVLKVAESGIDGPASATRLAEAGYHAILVGEHLVRAVDPVAALRALVGA